MEMKQPAVIMDAPTFDTLVGAISPAYGRMPLNIKENFLTNIH